jgi:hypothetical protein
MDAARASIDRAARKEKNSVEPIPPGSRSPVPTGNATREQDHTTGHATPPKNLNVFGIRRPSYPQFAVMPRDFCPIFQWFLASPTVLSRKNQPFWHSPKNDTRNILNSNNLC